MLVIISDTNYDTDYGDCKEWVSRLWEMEVQNG